MNTPAFKPNSLADCTSGRCLFTETVQSSARGIIQGQNRGPELVTWVHSYTPASWNSRMRLRRAWHGMSCLLSSSAPVAGEVLWVLSHCSMALRS